MRESEKNTYNCLDKSGFTCQYNSFIKMMAMVLLKWITFESQTEGCLEIDNGHTVIVLTLYHVPVLFNFAVIYINFPFHC